MATAMKSLEEYESHTPFRTAGASDSVKDATRAMMNIVETVSEKGKMTDNQYLEMMNHLLKIHKSEDTSIFGRRSTRQSYEIYEGIMRSALLYNDNLFSNS